MLLYVFKMTTHQKIEIAYPSVYTPYCRPKSWLELLQMPTQSSCRQVAGRRTSGGNKIEMLIHAVRTSVRDIEQSCLSIAVFIASSTAFADLPKGWGNGLVESMKYDLWFANLPIPTSKSQEVVLSWVTLVYGGFSYQQQRGQLPKHHKLFGCGPTYPPWISDTLDDKNGFETITESSYSLAFIILIILWKWSFQEIITRWVTSQPGQR